MKAIGFDLFFVTLTSYAWAKPALLVVTVNGIVRENSTATWIAVARRR